MKKIFVLVLLFCFLGCSSTSESVDSEPSENPVAPSRAVINAAMHIENTQNPDVDALIDAIDQLGESGITLSLGADYGWITSEPRVSEVFDHVIQWGGALDVHAHQSGFYNRADLANLITDMGYDVTHVVSGYTIDEEDALQEMIDPILGGEGWEPQYLWGLAEVGHGNDDNSWGITRYTEDGPPLIGNGVLSIASAENMVKQVADGDYPNMLLTCAIMIQPESLLVIGSSTDGIDEVIDFYSRSVALGAEWLTIQATGELADTDYPGQDSRVEGVSEKNIR